MSELDEKIIVGSQEWCGFPDLGIPAVKARADSGAKTWSIHAFNIPPFRRNRPCVGWDAPSGLVVRARSPIESN